MLLSVITINYNNAAGLRRTAMSVRQQSRHDFEWIVIDGGSTDGSRQVIEEFADLATYWVSERDRGIYHAMNKGVDAAKGDYLLFMNSGDAFYDTEVVADFYRRDNHEDVIYGREVGVDADGHVVWDWQLPDEPLRLLYFWEHTLKHQAMMISARCFERWRYNESHRINSDVELCMTLLYHGYVFGSWERYVARFDTSGVSSIDVDEALGHKEFNDTLAHLMPAGMVLDYKQLAESHQVDVIAMARELSHRGRWWRWWLRLLMYPTYWIAKLLK